ncbi:MAG: hypothetical protein H6739_28460 [Alphaproteobacteria bacterium]|nr:hypothetical protein [Alphaproteobacteria bacterium]
MLLAALLLTAPLAHGDPATRLCVAQTLGGDVMELEVNDHRVGDLHPRRLFCVDVPPGEHVIAVGYRWDDQTVEGTWVDGAFILLDDGIPDTPKVRYEGRVAVARGETVTVQVKRRSDQIAFAERDAAWVADHDLRAPAPGERRLDAVPTTAPTPRGALTRRAPAPDVDPDPLDVIAGR